MLLYVRYVARLLYPVYVVRSACSVVIDTRCCSGQRGQITDGCIWLGNMWLVLTI